MEVVCACGDDCKVCKECQEAKCECFCDLDEFEDEEEFDDDELNMEFDEE